MQTAFPDTCREPEVTAPDFYWEKGCLVFTEAYHLRRGKCCGSRCRHCPYTVKTASAGVLKEKNSIAA